MTTAARRLVLWTLAACLLAVAYVEQPEAVTPPHPLCQSQVRRVALTGEPYWAQRTLAHASQTDGGRWIIACSYAQAR
jgi:hypothetical protein